MWLPNAVEPTAPATDPSLASGGCGPGAGRAGVGRRQTSHAVKASRGGAEGLLFVVGLSGLEAVVGLSEEAVEEVALGGGVSVAVVVSALVVGFGSW